MPHAMLATSSWLRQHQGAHELGCAIACVASFSICMQVSKALLAWLDNIADNLQPPAAGEERTPQLLGLRPLPDFDNLQQACKVRTSSPVEMQAKKQLHPTQQVSH